VQVGGHPLGEHRGPSQAGKGDERGYGRTLCVDRAGDAQYTSRVRRHPGVVRELELATTRRAVHRVLSMFELHYQGLDRMELSGGWAPGISDAQCDDLEDVPPSLATWPTPP
jgi:hypothetical protein